jgi:hypothetical protein
MSNASNRIVEAGTDNFATIRAIYIVTKQIKDHEVSNELREQFAGYKRFHTKYINKTISYRK